MFKAVFAVALAFAITVLFVSKGWNYFSDFFTILLQLGKSTKFLLL